MWGDVIPSKRVEGREDEGEEEMKEKIGNEKQ